MDRAALALMASVVGIGFGWQPMRDGSPRYEYVVQIDPELAASLADGQTIPIVSETPADIQPVGQIRVVVGRGEVPRRRLVTSLKPVDAAASPQRPAASTDDGVKLAQYTQPGGGRYDQVPAQVLNPYPQGPASGDAAAGGSTWNGQDGRAAAPQTNATPSAGELFGGQATAAAGVGPTPYPSQAGGPAGTSWNSGATTPTTNDVGATGPLGRVGDRFQQATQPLRNGVKGVDDRVKSAAENLGNRSRQALNNLGLPVGTQQRSVVAADGRQPTVAAQAGAAPPWNNGAAATTGSTPSAPGNGPSEYGQAANAWNEAPGAATSAGGAQRAGAGATTAQDASRWNDGEAAGPGQMTARPTGGDDFGRRAGAGASAPPLLSPGTAPSDDRWAAASDPRLRTDAGGSTAPGGDPWTTSAGAVDRQPSSSNPNIFLGDGPQFPGFGSQGADQAQLGRGAQGGRGALSASPQQPGVPAIEAQALAKPAGRPLDEAVGGATSPIGAQTAAVGLSGPGVSGTPSQTQPASSGAFGAFTSGQGYGPQGSGQPQGQAGAAPRPEASSADAAGANAKAVAATLAAWVLLSGSVAGNLYLFWSYVDVRNKYRALVRKTARAVRGALSPA